VTRTSSRTEDVSLLTAKYVHGVAYCRVPVREKGGSVGETWKDLKSLIACVTRPFSFGAKSLLGPPYCGNPRRLPLPTARKRE
jgi:hypothetical protein